MHFKEVSRFFIHSFKRNSSAPCDEGRILSGYYGFSANISFTFQAVKNISAHPTHLRFGLFCKFFGDQGLSKIYGNGKF